MVCTVHPLKGLDLSANICSKVISFLPHQAQLNARQVDKVWYHASKELSCQFAFMRSILALSKREISWILKDHFKLVENLAHQKFNKILDPGYELTGRFLTMVLECKCTHDSADMMAFLRRLSNEKRDTIQSLNFSNIDITDDQITEIMALCPSVKFLTLSSSSITGRFLTQFKEQSQLEKLSLCGCKHLNEGVLRDFFSLKAFHLKELDLSFTNTTGEALSHILQDNQLEKLCLFSCQNLNEGILIDFFSLKASHLKELDLSSTNTTGEALSHISRESQLERLSLCRCERLNEEFLKDFLSQKASYLKALNLTKTGVTGEALSHISRESQLEHLFLWGCKHLNEEFLKTFLSSKASHLKVLDLFDTDITGESLVHILEQNLLKRLFLFRCKNLNEAFLKGFLSLKASHLKVLDLSETNITGEALPYILEDNQLKKLILSRCQNLNENFLRDFFSLKASHLKVLDLSSTDITGESLSLILEKKQLEKLMLGDCKHLNKDIYEKYLNNFMKRV